MNSSLNMRRPASNSLILEAESREVDVTELVAKSFRYSCLVLVAMAMNFSDRCTAFSALIAAKQKSYYMTRFPIRNS